MFTGLIEAIGRVQRVEASESSRTVHISAPFASELEAGDSVAVNGVCLTVTAVDDEAFGAVVSRETLSVTTFSAAAAGQLVNLERPVPANGRLGGHFVLGHVDGVARVTVMRADGESYWLEIEVPSMMRPYFVPKGSVAIDGISLTVASLDDSRVGVQVVPFTFHHTALQATRVGDAVNVETDVLGKYVVHLLARHAALAGER